MPSARTRSTRRRRLPIRAAASSLWVRVRRVRRGTHPLEQRAYVAEHQPLLTAQPVRADEVAASVLHFNTARALEAQERDAEWNTVGLTSGLQPAQYRAHKEKRTLMAMGEHIRAALAEAKKRSAEEIDAFVNSLAPRSTPLAHALCH